MGWHILSETKFYFVRQVSARSPFQIITAAYRDPEFPKSLSRAGGGGRSTSIENRRVLRKTHPVNFL